MRCRNRPSQQESKDCLAGEPTVFYQGSVMALGKRFWVMQDGGIYLRLRDFGAEADDVIQNTIQGV